MEVNLPDTRRVICTVSAPAELFTLHTYFPASSSRILSSRNRPAESGISRSEAATGFNASLLPRLDSLNQLQKRETSRKWIIHTYTYMTIEFSIPKRWCFFAKMKLFKFKLETWDNCEVMVVNFVNSNKNVGDSAKVNE